MKNEDITLKNTKAEILQALNESLAKEKNKMDTKFTPEKEEKENVTKKAIEDTKVNVEQKIFSEELNNKFKELEIAINSEEEKLKNLYEVESELQNLTVVINAGKDYLMQLEEEKNNKKEELTKDISMLEDEYSNKSQVLQKEYETAAKILKVERDRENEEYNYKLKREREIDNNKWLDSKISRETELSRKEKETMDLLADTNAKAEYLKELEDKVNTIPQTMQKEYDKGVEACTKELNKEHEHTVALLKKDYQSIIDRLNDKLETLNQEMLRIMDQNSVMQEKLDNAYAEIKNMATKTVESAGLVKIIGNSQNENSKAL